MGAARFRRVRAAGFQARALPLFRVGGECLEAEPCPLPWTSGSKSRDPSPFWGKGAAMRLAGKITPCLWFDDQAEAAAKFYTGIFPGSRIVKVTQYTEAGRDVHGKPAGKTMTVAFGIAGKPFTALNGWTPGAAS